MTITAPDSSREEAASAFETLQRRHDRRVLAFVSTRLTRRADADDVAQDVWVTVWDKMPTHYQHGSILSWIFQIAANRCIDHNRKRRPELFTEGELPDSTPWVESDPIVTAVVQREKMLLLKDCIDKLDHRLQCVVTSTLKGFKTGAVADRCGMTSNQVSKAKASATGLLQKCVEGGPQ